jgi:hypothetical protein
MVNPAGRVHAQAARQSTSALPMLMAQPLAECRTLLPNRADPLTLNAN